MGTISARPDDGNDRDSTAQQCPAIPPECIVLQYPSARVAHVYSLEERPGIAQAGTFTRGLISACGLAGSAHLSLVDVEGPRRPLCKQCIRSMTPDSWFMRVKARRNEVRSDDEFMHHRPERQPGNLFLHEKIGEIDARIDVLRKRLNDMISAWNEYLQSEDDR